MTTTTALDGEGRKRVEDALREAIAWATREVAGRAYRMCDICGATWWGKHSRVPHRTNVEPERHTATCPVPRWRAALTPTEEPR